MIKMFPLVFSLLLVTQISFADDLVFEAGILSPSLQIGNVNSNVKGFRLGLLYLESKNLKGLDIPIIAGRVKEEFYGVAIFGFYHRIDLMGSGFQSAIFNYVKGNFLGVQVAGLNLVDQVVRGVQIGVINITNKATGVQLGLFNHANELKGLQIGLINIAMNSSFLNVFPVFNFHFD